MEYIILFFIFIILVLLGGLYLMNSYKGISLGGNATKNSGLLTDINRGIGVAK
jgi:hypothetical protein